MVKESVEESAEESVELDETTVDKINHNVYLPNKKKEKYKELSEKELDTMEKYILGERRNKANRGRGWLKPDEEFTLKEIRKK